MKEVDQDGNVISQHEIREPMEDTSKGWVRDENDPNQKLPDGKSKSKEHSKSSHHSK